MEVGEAVDCDVDGDGHDASGACGGDDCDDANVDVFPAAGDTYADGVDQDCDGEDGAGERVGSAYLVVFQDRHVTWADAQLLCTSRGYDGLASIGSGAEQTVIDRLVSGLSGDLRWIGLNDQTTEGAFEWVDGTPVSYTNWQPAEPSGASYYGDEDCTVIQRTASGRWNDAACADSTFVSTYIDGIICSLR